MCVYTKAKHLFAKYHIEIEALVENFIDELKQNDNVIDITEKHVFWNEALWNAIVAYKVIR